MVTANVSLASGAPAGVPEVITIKHDFNVAWMNINTATLGVVKGGTTDVAGGSGNQLQLLITGTIPLLENYGELGLGSSITMPADWPRLANAMATFFDPLNPNPAQLWDIHDEFSPTQPDPDLHGAQSVCTHNTTLFVDTGKVEDRIETLSWVGHATASRELPGTIRITVTPRLVVGWAPSGDFSCANFRRG